MKNLHVKTGDLVVVLSGDDRKMKKGDEVVARTGKVIATSPEEGKVIVEGVHVVAKHTKARKQGDVSGIVKTEGAIYASKVQLYCPKCEKGVRTKVGYEEVGGKKIKVRLCAKCGAKI